MIATEFYRGQGTGNQLWAYVVTRVIAEKRGFDFGVIHPENFLGKDFMDPDLGKPVEKLAHAYTERALIHPLNGSDIRTADPALERIQDGTKLDGYFQDENYILDRKEDIRKWLAVKPELDKREFSSDDICVINFRGGGYAFDVDFFLPKRYWDNAIAHMRKINQDFKFVVVTDDPKTGKKFFPDFDVYHWSINGDYSVIKNARYLILSNSSFAFFPAWTSTDLKYCIAPKYFARHNISDGYWSLGYNLVRNWNYLDRKGNLSDYETCKKELDAYIQAHPELYVNPKPFKRSFGRLLASSWQNFNTIRKDTSALYAFSWVAHARGLRSAIWIHDRFKIKDLRFKIFQLNKSTKRFVKKILVRWPEQLRERRIENKARRTWHSPAEIVEYRKKIKVYDVFSFFNELDLLELRMEILGPYVDYFVIAEAREGFSGDKKPFYFQDNKERYKKWEHKIIHLIVEDVPEDAAEYKARLNRPDLSPEDRKMIEWCFSTKIVDHSQARWIKEFYIKESVRKALAGLRDDDICYFSDTDEIWDPELGIDYSKDDIFRLRQRPYMYYVNNRSDEHWRGWTGTVATKYGNVRDRSINVIRSHKGGVPQIPLHDAGWHFNFLGGAEGARRKIVESNHPHYRSEKVLPGLEQAVAANRDHRDPSVKLWIDESDLPEYLLTHKEKWKKFFL